MILLAGAGAVPFSVAVSEQLRFRPLSKTTIDGRTYDMHAV